MNSCQSFRIATIFNSLMPCRYSLFRMLEMVFPDAEDVLNPPVERTAVPGRRYRYAALAGHVSALFIFVIFL